MLINNMKPNSVKYKNVLDRIPKPMSDSELERYLGSPSSKYVVKYSQLDDFNTIDQLLPDDKSFKIILTEQEFNNGHWTCIMRYKDGDKDVIEYFNSYGSKPSYELGFISKVKNLFLGQDEKHLNQLLNRALKEKKYDIIYNKTKFQKYSNDIQTCGRWCVLRILRLKEFNDNLAEFIQFIKDEVNKYKKVFEEKGLPKMLWNDFIASMYIA